MYVVMMLVPRRSFGGDVGKKNYCANGIDDWTTFGAGLCVISFSCLVLTSA